VTLINSTVSGNSAIGNNVAVGTGGGIYHISGFLMMTNSTVSFNSASGSGGGIYNIGSGLNSGTVNIFNSTIFRNTAGVGTAAGVGGGVSNGSSLVMSFQNTILARNRAVTSINPFPVLDFDDCAGTIDSDGHNLMGVQNCTVTGAAPLVGDPQLGSLKNNGGPTKTHALPAGSPAIDAGDCTLGPKPLTDQRGFIRTVDGDQNGTFTCDIGAYEFGAGSPGPLDFDGDGETDVAVYQTSTGNWFVVGSTAGFFSPALNFGGSGFIPVPGDYDGDGETDVAVYQSSSGNWFVVGTTSGFFTPALNFGGAGYIPAPGDYDGDGKTDPAVYRSSTGNWSTVGSTSGLLQILGFGGSGYIPVPGDYDGDGVTDAAVYQSSSGNWFVVGTSAGFFTPALNFGGTGFVPVLPQVTILRAMGVL